MEAGCAVCKPRGMGNGIVCFQDGRSSAMVRRGLSWGLSPRAVCGKRVFCSPQERSNGIPGHFTMAQSKGQLHLEVGLFAGQMKGAVSETRLKNTLAPPKCPCTSVSLRFVASRNEAF